MTIATLSLVVCHPGGALKMVIQAAPSNISWLNCDIFLPVIRIVCENI